MGALSPLFFAAGLAVGVPIFLHLFQRHQTRRVSFPALRYLQRTEREHARQIRLRQLILLLVRVAVVLVLVGAGARLFFNGRGTAHPPTAVVIVLDNSMSSGLVIGEQRVLDRLKALAIASLDEASPEDRFWVLRAGEPWLPALPGGAAEARLAIEATEPSDAWGDLASAVRRASLLVSATELKHYEVHLLSDLQRTGFPINGDQPAGDVPVIVWEADEDTPSNGALTQLVVGGGLPPLEGQRSEVTITALENGGDTARLALRLVVNERIRGAASVPPGSATSVGLPPAGGGWIRGYADSDPDALRADDRRYFAYKSRPAPTVASAGVAGLFADQALSVLESAGRITVVPIAGADLLVSAEGEGLDGVRPLGSVLVIPPADPTRLPALNRRLADAQIPWRLEARSTTGDADLSGRLLPEALSGVRAREWYRLRLIGDPINGASALVEAGDDSWAVQGQDALGRRYLLVASALDAASSSLPVSTAMLQFFDWAASEWAGLGGVASPHFAGDHLSAPRTATKVRFPSGEEFDIDGTRMVRGTGSSGFYTFLDGDNEISVVAVNSPVEESRLSPLSSEELRSQIGREVVVVRREAQWSRNVFRSRQGPELWWTLLLVAASLLIVEALLAASGRVGRASTTRAQSSQKPVVDAAA